uniref:Putative secreted protein n=1 Tax=Anopheles triannulatus TaxID=58253 RepID=A0A2M4B474_9DIPT
MALTFVSLLTNLVNMVSCSSSKFRANSVSTVGEWRCRFIMGVWVVLYSRLKLLISLSIGVLLFRLCSRSKHSGSSLAH